MTDEVVMIDLNQADVEELTTLLGIGSVLAERIVEYRETVHPFEEVIELAAVPGISERTVRSFEDRVMVATPEVIDAEGIAPAAELVETIPAEPEGETETMPDTTVEEIGTPEGEPEITAETAGEPDVVVFGSGDEETAETMDEEVEPDQFAELDFAAPPPRAAESRPDEVSHYRPVVADEVDAPPVPAEEQEKKAQRRGCFALVAGAVLGAVVGAILSLAIIAQLNNGTLSFYQADTQLRSELNRASQVQEDLDVQLGQLDTQASYLSTRTMEMAQQQETADETLAELQQTISDIEREVDALEAVTEALDERLVSVAAAAETFNAFLNGLRDLLFDLQGAPAAPDLTVTPTAEVEPTSMATPADTTAPESPAEEAPTATPTGARQPTRTPRPTATPFLSLPTSTPEPQP